jgi:methenyltetrahydromethanopterin cyclohydrolase
MAERCGVDPENLYLVLSPLSSMPGVVQVTGKSVENAMVKLNTLHYSVKAVKHACGIAPVPPSRSKVLPDDMLSYASVVHLSVLPSDGEDLETVVRRLPFQTSKSYGKSFSTLTREHGGLQKSTSTSLPLKKCTQTTRKPESCTTQEKSTTVWSGRG